MNEEKKTLRETTTEQKSASLDDASLEAVSGGGQPAQWVTDAWERLQSQSNSNNVTEQQP